MPNPIKYFRKEVSRLINKYYGTKVSESEVKDYESKYIEYAANGDFDIYVLVVTDGWKDYFKMCSEDLRRFVVRPRGIINMGELKLYTVASEKISFIYYEIIVPEHGDDGDIPEVPKKGEISTRLFQIKEEDLILLEEVIKRDCQQDLKVKQGEGKEKNTFTIKPQETKSVETILFYDKITGKFKFGKLESEAISKTSKAKVRDVAEKLMEWWMTGKSCPQKELLRNPEKTPPQTYYDNITTIRNALKNVKVNMPQCAEEAYHSPSEPKHFDIINKS